MKIYRIQRENGEGPYRNMNYCLFTRQTELSSYTGDILFNTHPGPGMAFDDENYAKFNADYVFGFSSLWQYKKWTINDRIRADLDNNGFHLYEFEVEDEEHVAKSDSQVAFIPKKAKVLKIRPCNYLGDKN